MDEVAQIHRAEVAQIARRANLRRYLRAMHEQGMTEREMAKTLGIARQTVHKAIK